MAEICRFKFKEGVSKELIEEQMALAIVTAECTFGQARVRLHGSYPHSGASRPCSKEPP